jgi:HEAT repeat protein
MIKLLDGDEKQTLAIGKASVSLYQRHQNDASNAEDVLRIAREAISEESLSQLAEALASADAGTLPSLIPFAGLFPDETLSERLCTLIDNEDLREQVVAGLLVQGETAIGPLIRCLDSEDAETRRYAARSLGKIGNAGAVIPLISFLEQGTLEDALAAIDALGSIDTPESVKILLEQLDDTDPKIREAAVRALGRLARVDLADLIISKSKDEDELVRHAAIEQIPSMAGHAGLSAIVESLQTDTPRVRAAAARAVAQIEHPDAIEPLRKALNDADAWTRYFAVRGIGARRDIASADKLKEMIEADPAEQVRMAAREVSSELGI